jgi:hypothetical protein
LREVDIDRPHFNAMLAGIAHELGRSIKPIGCALRMAARKTSG